MKTGCLLTFVTAAIIQLSCNNSSTDSNTTTTSAKTKEVFITDPAALTKDYKTWYNYAYYHVRLSQDFIGLDTDSVQIEKANFLHKLMTENLLAYKAGISGDRPVYKLCKLNTNDESIIATSKQMAYMANENFKMEGKPVPGFNFTDLQGNQYSNATVKGKIVVFKCWFIHCVACVQEFPQLNKLVDDYPDRKDVLFISLALDDRKDLAAFLQTKEFKYATVPELKDYLAHKLNITVYPTHILIGRDGIIKKVTGRVEDLLPSLDKEAGRNR